jgi:transaldolase
MRIKIFMDGANLDDMLKLKKETFIKGFTTNPTLMRKAGISDFESYCRHILKEIPDMPISFEVFADDYEEMKRQAHKITSWGENVYVKIPIMNTKRVSSISLIRELSSEGIKLNITAIMTAEQVRNVIDALSKTTSTFVSVFAGRIADTGVDPLPIMIKCMELVKTNPMAELLWASPREVFNLYQAEKIGCHIITMVPELIAKIPLNGKSLDEYSLETVQMFYSDAVKAGYKL